MKPKAVLLLAVLGATSQPSAVYAADCKPDDLAYIGGGNISQDTLYRDAIPIRPVLQAKAWATGCPVYLNQTTPSGSASSCQKQNVLMGATLEIGDDYMVTLSNGGKTFAKTKATAEPHGAWLHLLGETGIHGAKQDDFYIYVLDYLGASLPHFTPIPKIYMVEVFDGEERKECRDEQPIYCSGQGPCNVTKRSTVSLSAATAATLKDSDRAKVAAKDGAGPASQSDVGVGPESRK